MGKTDDETGITPAAKDGAPDQVDADNELARRKALKAERERKEEEQVTNGGRAVDDQPEPAEPTEAEMFPSGSIMGDHKVTMKNIVPAGKARKTEAKMGSTAIPLRDGLVAYGELVELLVTVEAGSVKEVPDLEESDAGGRRRLVGVKDVQSFRPVYTRTAAGMLTIEQVVDLLETRFGIPRSADKIAEVFGPQTPEQRSAAAS